MFSFLGKTLTATVLVGAAITQPSAAQTVDVQQYWTSKSEAKAMNALANEFKARGGTWIDSPAASSDNNIAVATSRIAGGDAPSAILMTPTSVLTELAQGGLLRDFNDLSKTGGWKDKIAPIVWNKLVVDDKLVALPVGIQSTNWVWYSKPIFNELGIEEPKTSEELFAAADKVQKAGYIGIATGGQGSQEGQVLFSLLLAHGGNAFWTKLFQRDEETLKSPILKDVFDMVRKVSRYSDPSRAGRGWNDTTNLVITKKAGIQFLGDWAKGEFAAAGQVAGKDFGCFLTPGIEKSYSVLIDVFSFPATSDADRTAGQNLLAESLMDPAVQVKVSEAKGSVPARADVDRGNLDACAALGSEVLATQGAAVTAIYNVTSNDVVGELMDLATRFYNDANMTSSQAADEFANIIRSH